MSREQRDRGVWRQRIKSSLQEQDQVTRKHGGELSRAVADVTVTCNSARPSHTTSSVRSVTVLHTSQALTSVICASVLIVLPIVYMSAISDWAPYLQSRGGDQDGCRSGTSPCSSSLLSEQNM